MFEPDSNSVTTTRRYHYRKIALLAIFLFVFLVTCLAGWYFSYTFSEAPATSEKEVIVSIPPGTSVKRIASILAEAGLIKEDIRFLLLAKFSGLGKKLQAGEFKIETNALPKEVLFALATDKPVTYKITIPEGLNVFEIASLLEKRKWSTVENFLSLTQDATFIEELGLKGLQKLEGYLFPDTYYFTRSDLRAKKIIKKMVDRFNVVWQELSAAETTTPDREKTVILASIVEKETGSPDERGLIAGVFLNRLNLGMKLQSDPTVLYGLTDGAEKITKKHLKQNTPYNTYVIKGLPVGPICNPGAQALGAVLSPETSKYLYFVSKNDGTHKFSANLREHNKAVIKYQRKKSVKKGK